jgi:hypothetical protein
MIFETKSGLYWPIDESAHHVLNHFGFISPLDWQSYEAMIKMIEADQLGTVELWEPDNPFSLPVERH